MGLALSGAIFLFFWIKTMEWQYEQKVFYYKGFLFWEQCKKEGKSDLQAATERYRIIHRRPGFQASHHPDVKRGHPEAFIRGTLGHEIWDGFGYGKKPGRLETLFEYHTIKTTIDIMAMMLYLPYVAMLLAPCVGGLVGLILGIKNLTGATHTQREFVHKSSDES